MIYLQEYCAQCRFDRKAITTGLQSLSSKGRRLPNAIDIYKVDIFLSCYVYRTPSTALSILALGNVLERMCYTKMIFPCQTNTSHEISRREFHNAYISQLSNSTRQLHHNIVEIICIPYIRKSPIRPFDPSNRTKISESIWMIIFVPETGPFDDFCTTQISDHIWMIVCVPETIRAINSKILPSIMQHRTRKMIGICNRWFHLPRMNFLK